jgi:hypothetical protein
MGVSKFERQLLYNVILPVNGKLEAPGKRTKSCKNVRIEQNLIKFN